jgi:hypothetical protein
MYNAVPEAVACDVTVDAVTELETLVQCRLGGQVRDFHIVATGSGIILRGHTHTYYAKQLAQHAVIEKSTLPIVANEIEVS